jgi:hypothetical protein
VETMCAVSTWWVPGFTRTWKRALNGARLRRLLTRPSRRKMTLRSLRSSQVGSAPHRASLRMHSIAPSAPCTPFTQDRNPTPSGIAS